MKNKTKGTEMTITAYGPDLLEIVKSCGAIVPSRVSLPITGMARVVAKGLALTVTTTNLDLCLSLSCNCKGDDAEFLVDAHKLQSAIEAVGDEHARLIVGEDSISVKGGSFSCKLPTAEASEFPEWSMTGKKKTMKVDATELKYRVQGCAYAVAPPSETRLTLRGININKDRVFAATDGHQLSVMNPILGKGDLGDVIIPVSTLKAIIANAGEEVELASDGSALEAVFDRGHLLSKIIDGAYPTYQRIIEDAKRERFARVNAAEFVAAVRAVVPFSVGFNEKRSETVELKISALGVEVLAVGEGAEAAISVQGKISTDHRLRIDAGYMLTAISALGVEVLDIVTGNQLGPVFFEKAGEGDAPSPVQKRFCIVLPIIIPKEK